jgi:6-phosphofructokinase 1
LDVLHRNAGAAFVDDAQRVLVQDVVNGEAEGSDPGSLSFEMAGPRRWLYFDPDKTKAAIVTCGGLCPGLNDVIRGIVSTLNKAYGVQNVVGVRYGYRGFAGDIPPVELTRTLVEEVRRLGGTMLGSSRGPQKVSRIVEWLSEHSINILFAIGGDGTIRGAHEIVKELGRRDLKISVIGLPKTIDNDFLYMDKSFGFETAFAEAVRAVRCAHSEATGCINGIGLIKLMGRESGFIAAHAALAEACVNFVLVPEVPFRLDGEDGLLRSLQRRLASRGHAVIVVAEGAGQDLFRHSTAATDSSGNRRMEDIGVFLKTEIERYFRKAGTEINLKYIDPSYVIRSVPANAQDEIFCMRLAQHAVHAGMAGKTGVVIGRWHEHFVHLPMDLVAARRRQIDPRGDLWMAVQQSIG